MPFATDFESIAHGPRPEFYTSASRKKTPLKSASQKTLSKRRPQTAEAAQSAINGWKKHHERDSPALKDPFDPSASNFGRFNSHYPRSLREYFHRPRTAVAEMPKRLGKVKNNFERLSTYGLKSNEPVAMKTQLHFLRNDPVYETIDRSNTDCQGTMTNGRGDTVPWDNRHHNTYSRCNGVFHEVHKEFFDHGSRLERIPIHRWRGPPKQRRRNDTVDYSGEY